MNGPEIFADAIGRIREHVESFSDLDEATLAVRPGTNANTIGWLLWHLTRVQDAHVAELVDGQQLWTDGGSATRLGFDPDPHDTGYGYTTAQVGDLRIGDTQALVEYHHQVAERTLTYLRTLDDEALDRVVDENWDPPVTLGVRLMSIVEDCLEHIGQASYVRGLLGA
jgi:hypothetical protein